MANGAPGAAPSGGANNINTSGDSVVSQFDTKINQIMLQSLNSSGPGLKGHVLGKSRKKALYDLYAVRNQIVGAKITSSSEIARLELLLKEMESRIRGEDPKAAMNRYGGTKINAKEFDPNDPGSPFRNLYDVPVLDAQGNPVLDAQGNPEVKKGIESEYRDQQEEVRKAETKVVRAQADGQMQDDLKQFYEEQNKIIGEAKGYKDQQELIRNLRREESKLAGSAKQANAIRRQNDFIEDLNKKQGKIADKYKDALDDIRRDKNMFQDLYSKGKDVSGQLARLEKKEDDIRSAIMNEEAGYNKLIADGNQKLIEMENSQEVAKMEAKKLKEMIDALESELGMSPAQDLNDRKAFLQSKIADGTIPNPATVQRNNKDAIELLSSTLGYIPQSSGHITHPKILDDLIDQNNESIKKCINDKRLAERRKGEAEKEVEAEKITLGILKEHLDKAMFKHYKPKDKAMIEAIRGDLYETERELASMKARQEGLRVLLNDGPEYIEQGMPTYEFDEDGVGHVTGQQTIRVPNPNGQSGVIIDRINELRGDSRFDTVGGTLGSIVTGAAEGIGKIFGGGSSIRDAFNRGRNGTP